MSEVIIYVSLEDDLEPNLRLDPQKQIIPQGRNDKTSN